MVALANASSSHVRSRRSSPAADDEALDAEDEKAEKEDEDAVPDELAVKQADDAHVEASPLLLDSVSETAAAVAAAAEARVRVSGSGEHASESATPSAGVGAGAAAAGGEDFFFFFPFFFDADDGFIAPVAVASPWAFPLPYSPLRLGVSRARGGFDFENFFSRGEEKERREGGEMPREVSTRTCGGRRAAARRWAHVEWPATQWHVGYDNGGARLSSGKSRADG